MNSRIPFLRRLLNLFDFSEELDFESAVGNIRRNVPFHGTNIFILACAIIIASLGLNLNSTAVIIGAMLVSPLMGPILGFGLGLGINDTRLVASSLKHYGVMVGISIFVSTVYFFISPLNLTHQTELLARTNPTIYDVLIALFGGAAGMFEHARKEKGTVISGVAIATALMPPLCTVGYGIAHLNLHFVTGALYLFLINSIFIAISTFLVVKYLRFPSVSGADERRILRSRRLVYVILTVIIVPSIFSAYNIVKQTNFERNVETLVEKNKILGRSYIFNSQTDASTKPSSVRLYVAGEKLSDDERERIYSDAESLGFLRSQILIHEDAAVKEGNGLDAELMKGIFEHNTETINQLNQTVVRLDSTVNAYRAQELPYAQLSEEICAQYEDIDKVTLSRGESVVTATGEKGTATVAIVHTPKSFPEEARSKLENWLRVRLASDDVTVIVNHEPVAASPAPLVTNQEPASPGTTE